MNRQVLTYKIISNHAEFVHYINSLSEQEFMLATPGKWNAGQQLDHILRAVRPVNLAFNLPFFVPRILFGKLNRKPRTYSQLVQRYQEKLQNGGRASGRFVPGPVPFHKRSKLSSSLLTTARKLSKLVSRMDEEDLDRILLPHPLLGKLTLREMLFFTIYHVEHHLTIMRHSLGHDAATNDRSALRKKKFHVHQHQVMAAKMNGY